MSSVQRYDVTSDMAMPRDDGRWVKYEDHAAALASEREKFAALQEVFDKAQGFIDDKATWGQLVAAVETVEALRPAPLPSPQCGRSRPH